MRRGRLFAIALGAGAAALALAGPGAAAHSLDDYIPAGATEPQIRAIETAMLGAEHAAEHAAARRSARLAERGVTLRIDGTEMAYSSEGVAAPRAAGPPAQVGAWTEAPFRIPTYAIHSVVLPTGKVLFWGRPPVPGPGQARPNYSEAALWDPALGTGPGAFTDVDPPVIDVDGPGGQPPAKAPIFCSGQTLTPSGEVVAAGGTLVYAGTFPDDAYTDWGGLQTIFTFDPFSERWTRQPDMAEGRWYPGQVMLPDGRTVILSGLSDEPPGGLMTNSVEVFSPPATIGGQGSVVQEPSATRAGLGLYPRTFTVGDDVVVTGPSQFLTATLDTYTFGWNESLPTMSRSRIAGNAVRRAGGPGGSDTITTIGGFDRNIGAGPFYAGTTTAETIDAGNPSAAWRGDASWNVGRANANTILLPDGSMVTIGGGSGFQLGGDPELGAAGGYITYADGRARQVEVYDPDSGRWLLGPAQREDRTYHSTAVLLPDGRVFSAGDDHYPTEPGGAFSITDNAEIYSPPYLFKGARPQIDSAPGTVGFGDTFGIESESPKLERAVLMSPGATTHAFDMHQRQVELEIVRSPAGRGVDVISPPSDAVAPPGYYMLFLLNDAGVPSVATWIRIDPGAPDRPALRDDTDRPKLKVKAKKRQRLAKPVKLKLSCDEVCAVEVEGKVKPKHGAGSGSARPKAVALKQADVELAANKAKRLKLKLSRRAKRTLGSVDKATAKIVATASDRAGNKTTARVKVTLR
jgi:hypothetical protein